MELREFRRVLGLAMMALLLLACSGEKGKFVLEGRLRNINYAEFWIYSPDGLIAGIDTIKVRDGRFSYEQELNGEGTLMIVFPNYYEQPVFAGPGESVSIKGDATHLKEMIIQGTTENEDLTTLRMELNDLTPPDIPAAVTAFITENPTSMASIYLLRHFFIQNPEPDFQQALKLTRLMLKANPDNTQLTELEKQLKPLQGGKKGSTLPRFNAKDTKGGKVTQDALKREANVVLAWATWNYPSMDIQRKVKELKKRHGDRLGVVGICIDGQPSLCRQQIARDTLKWQTVCDGKQWETPLLSTFGLADVPGNVIINGKGRVVARNLNMQQLEQQINNILK